MKPDVGDDEMCEMMEPAQESPLRMATPITHAPPPPPRLGLDPLSMRDPKQCHAYVPELYEYLRRHEQDCGRVSPRYMQVRTAARLVRNPWAVCARGGRAREHD